MALYKDHSEKLDLLKSGKLNLVDNVQEFLNRIKDNANLNAFNFVFEEDVINSAKKVQIKISEGNQGKLAGMVVAVKDVLSIKDKPLTCSSKILQNFKAL